MNWREWEDAARYASGNATGGGGFYWTHFDPFAGSSERARESRERLRLTTILAKLKLAVDDPVLDRLQPEKLGRAARAMAGADPERFARMNHGDAVAWLRRTAQELR